MNFIVEALHALKPGAEWSLNGNNYEGLTWLEPSEEDGGQTMPSKEEVLNEIDRLKEVYNNTKYQRDRVKAYPSITEQLDMIYHEGIDAWKIKIQEIKDTYPKP